MTVYRADIFLFVLSFLSLAFELIVCKSFKIEYALNSSFMIVVMAVAVFGLGTGSALVCLSKKIFNRGNCRLFLCIFLFVTALSGLCIYVKLSFIMRLACVMSLFAGFGITIALLFEHGGGNKFRLYSGSLLGSGFGAALTPVLFRYAGMEGTLWIALVIICAAAWAAVRGAGRIPGLMALCGIAGLGLCMPALTAPLPILDMQRDQFSRKVAVTRWGHFCRIDVARDASPVERALSGCYTGGRTYGYYFTIDGSTNEKGVFAQYSSFPRDFEHTESLKYELGFFPNYLVPGDADILVIGPGGGKDVFAAGLLPGKRRIRAVEMNPLIIETAQRYYPDSFTRIYGRQNVELVVDEIRVFLARDDRAYDLIQIPGVRLTIPYFLSSAHVFRSELNYVYTREALEEYICHLKEDGLLAVTQSNAPDFAPQIVRNLGSIMHDIAGRVIILEGGMAVTVLIKREPFSPAEREKTASLAHAFGFDTVYPATGTGGIDAGGAPTAPYSGEGCAVSTDDRPFAYTRLPRDPGRMIRVLIVALSVFAAFLFLAALRVCPQGRGYAVRISMYFFGLGAAYIFVETFLLQKFSFFIGQPVYAFSVVAGALLVFNGIGSLLIAKNTVPVRNILAALAVLCVVYYGVLPCGLHCLMKSVLPWRIMYSVLIIAPLACCMGMPFPCGLERIKRTAGYIPYALGINAFAAVLGMLVSLMLCIAVGYRILMAGAALIYGLLFFAGQVFSERN